MPAQLRNRQHLVNGKANGASTERMNGLASQSPVELDPFITKKLIQIEEEDHTNNNDSDRMEDTFSDTCTMGSHCKIPDENPMIFSELKTSINQTARDQFAVALLRLQTDLDAASRRLTEVESRVDGINRLQRNRDAQIKASTKSSGLFCRDNLVSLAYLSWPIIIIVAMKAIERRSVASK